jgi:hypothetical protein
MQGLLILLALVAGWIVVTRVIFPRLGIEMKSC